MRIHYQTKPYIINEDSKIEVMWVDSWMPATICDLLYTQLTANIHVAGEPLSYLFYADIGETWRPKDA